MKAVVSLILLLAVVATGCRGSSTGAGGLDSVDMRKKPSPDFALINQDGAPVTLSSLRGKVIALTFLYTSCPDVCPIVATTFGQAYDKLGSARGKTDFVVVTVDPERDTVERMHQYLSAQGLLGKLQFLTGDRAELEKTWAAYYVGVARGTPQGDGPDAFYEVTHTNLVYLIDAEGRQRTLIKGYQFTADQLIDGMRPLISDAG